jgi:hypothetical protein
MYTARLDEIRTTTPDTTTTVPPPMWRAQRNSESLLDVIQSKVYNFYDLFS